MSNNGITNATYISSVFNSSSGGANATDVMAYVESLLIQEYDSQMKDMANSIKMNNRIKEAVRLYKAKVNELLNKTQKDGKVELSEAEYNMLNYQPDFRWDSEMYDGLGGVRDYSSTDTDIAAITNQSYVDTDYSGTNLIAANQTASWQGDPHFYDADGTGKEKDWDFQGIAGNTYNYFNDTNASMDATHIAYSGDATVVGTIAITLNGPNNDSNILFTAGSTPTLNDVAMESGKTYETADGGTATYNLDSKTLTVTTAEGYTMTVADRGGYLDGAVQSGSGGVAQDGRMPDGILGSTFDEDTTVNDNSNNEKYDVTGQTTEANTSAQTYKVEVDRIKSVIDGFQSKLDSLNGSSEMAQTDLSTLTSQRKLAFETLSSMISKVADGASTVVRNIK